ncbi:MAG: DNA methyltransferase, partial [Gemmatimonadota bacterium]
RFILQSVVTMFAEDFGLLPKDLLSYLVADCVEGASSYDLIGGLFRQMADPKSARGGRYADVRYFNGGLFSRVEPIELTKEECALLGLAAAQRWSAVAPPIFGTLFQRSMDAERRHALGAHFTAEADIQKVVLPTIVTPWLDRLDATSTRADLESLLKDLLAFRVLDPACGSGNFLYVAYRELVNVEMEILRKIHENYGERARKAAGSRTLISTTQFHGIDIDPFAVELAKVTLMLAKRIAVAETRESRFAAQHDLPFEFEKPLPLDNLDENIVAGDALFLPWPKSDAIVSNPPYQSKNKMQQEYGAAYVHDVRERYPDVPGRADYCVYWFRRAHDELAKGGRAGLVGTNTIRQNYSREGGLDYIVGNGGTITQAVSSQAWSGEAQVSVSIVNWIKGAAKGPKKLFRQLGDHPDSPWEVVELPTISAALSGRTDVTKAHDLACAVTPETTYQGQTHGHEGFVLESAEARDMIASDGHNKDVVHPFLIGDDILGSVPPAPQRYVIDFSPRDILTSQRYAAPFKRIEAMVLPDRKAAAQEEERRNAELLKRSASARVNRHHGNFLARWWQLSYARGELMGRLRSLNRYIACSRVTKRPIFVFVASSIHPSDALQVFVFDDDYSFGILQSNPHWEWF